MSASSGESVYSDIVTGRLHSTPRTFNSSGGTPAVLDVTDHSTNDGSFTTSNRLEAQSPIQESANGQQQQQDPNEFEFNEEALLGERTSLLPPHRPREPDVPTPSVNPGPHCVISEPASRTSIDDSFIYQGVQEIQQNAGNPPPARRLPVFNRKCCCCCCLLITTVSIMIVVFVVGIVLLWVTAIPTNNSSSTSALLKGDYVLLNINTKEPLPPLFEISLSVTKSIKDTTSRPFTNDPFINTNNEKQSRHYFSNCSRYPALCPIDQYVYQIKRSPGVMRYNVSVYPFVSGDTIIRFLVFDDEKKYRDYLNGLIGVRDAFKVETMDFSTTNFSINYEQLQKQESYYFFVLENVINDPSHAPNWFEVTRFGEHVYYEGLDLLDSYCELYSNNNNSTCRTPLPLQKQYCFVAHLQGAGEEALPAVPQDHNHLHKGGGSLTVDPHDDEVVYINAAVVRTAIAQGLFDLGCVLVSIVPMVLLVAFISYLLHHFYCSRR